MTNNHEYDYNFSTNSINSSYIFNYKELLQKDLTLINYKFLKRLQKRSSSPLPLTYYYNYITMRHYVDSFKGVRFNYQNHSKNRLILNSMVNLVLKNNSLSLNDYFMNSILVFPEIRLLIKDRKDLNTNLMILSKVNTSGKLVQMFTGIGKYDKFILTLKDLNNVYYNNLFEIEYFKVLPEPLDNFNFHFKLGKHNQTFSLCTSILDGNYIGFEAARSNDNIVLTYKYSLLSLNTIKGLNFSCVYHKNIIHLDLFYKFSKKYNMMLKYAVNEFSFEEIWKLIFEARYKKDRIYLSLNQNLNDIHFLYNYRVRPNLTISFSLDFNIMKVIPNKDKKEKRFFNKLGFSINIIDDNKI